MDYRYIGLFYGGVNYALPDPNRDGERFQNLRDAADTLWRRADFDPFYPCVESPELHLYRGEYTENGPDYIITLGPRGGVHIDRA